MLFMYLDKQWQYLFIHSFGLLVWSFVRKCWKYCPPTSHHKKFRCHTIVYMRPRKWPGNILLKFSRIISSFRCLKSFPIFSKQWKLKMLLVGKIKYFVVPFMNILTTTQRIDCVNLSLAPIYKYVFSTNHEILIGLSYLNIFFTIYYCCLPNLLNINLILYFNNPTNCQI